MKFKDLEIGQRFTQVGWMIGTRAVKIEPVGVVDPSSGRVAFATHKDVSTGIRGWFVKDDDEVIRVDKPTAP